MDISETKHDSFFSSGPHESIWSVGIKPGEFARLASDVQVDVAIIGGGITGLTAAAQLARAGRTVAVLEAKTIGAGTTSHSTGNLYATVDQRLHVLARHWGEEKARAIVESRNAALGLIERNVAEYRLECDFSRQPWVLYSIDGLPEESDDIEAEYHAALAAGLDARLALDLPLPYTIRKALVVRNQAQFHPLQYLRQLAGAIQSPVCRIFEDANVIEINEHQGMLRTLDHVVRASHIIMATHVPKGFNLVQAEVAPYREYAVAAPVEREQLPGGIFWSAGTKSTSTRALRIGGQSYVMMVGGKHKTGQSAPSEDHYQTLEALLQARFAVQSSSFRWSAQHYRAADGLPYIGASARGSRQYHATGFATDGLVYGTLAGVIMADEICGIDNPYAHLYAPHRFTPMKSAKNFIRENLNIAGQYLKDYLQGADIKDLDRLLPGQGALVEHEGTKVAAFRDDLNHLHLLSPVCTHLKCIVHWNSAERSWDCPCHGSRYQYDGKVIEGPTLQPLARYDPGKSRT
jgi:glycine/D-amino acid oxidase-like deaminating enzyme/nitrite reductase/ring-hydroxylating ferredoxin subunit